MIHPVSINMASVYDLMILVVVSGISYIFAFTSRRIARGEGIFISWMYFRLMFRLFHLLRDRICCCVLFNTLLYTICGIAIQSWILPLYSIATYYVGSRTVDFITEGFDRAKCAMIVTVKANEISDALSEYFEASGTIVKAIGGYSKEDKEIIYFIVNRFQINKLKNIVHDIDKSAFISLQDVADIIKNHE